MQLPVGMLIYKAQRFSQTEAMVMGLWYYKEIFVPSTIEDKKKSGEDLKRKRCTVLLLRGTFEQICEIIMQSDRYIGGSGSQIHSYAAMIEKLEETLYEPVMFDEITTIRGTSLSVDIEVEVEDGIESVRTQINAWKPVAIDISPGWSFFKKFFKGI